MDTALQTPMARSVARKAGLRQGTTAFDGPATALDAYVDPVAGFYAHQFEIDLTGMSRVRFSAQSPILCYLLYSPSTSGASSEAGSSILEPTDWTPLAGILDEPGHPSDGDYFILNANAAFASTSGRLLWVTLAEEHKIPLRVAPSSDASIPFFFFFAGFSIALQAE